MDEPGGSAQTAPPPSRRKTKGKAPLPPSEGKHIGKSTSDVFESTNYKMEQKENMIVKEIELTVVLPGDLTTSTTVNGSKPMMDLLVFLCGQYHLNPSTYTVDLISTDKSQIKFKPNTPIGMLEVERAILKPKNVDEKNKRPTPVVPEQTVRVVINYKKTQKTVMRVSPHVSLQELTPTICSKCEFDPLHTVLLKDYQSQEPLDLTKSLNDLGVRELYAIDNSRGTLAGDVHSSLHDSSQISQHLDMLKQKENEKGFFSFFRRSKKKREQTSSAPATPLLSKQRPASLTRSSTLIRHYNSHTLPFEMPKKRRAPLPPMHVSLSVQNNMVPNPFHSGSLIVKSVSVDGADKEMSRIIRTGSLQLSSTSSSSSSLKRTKRKAPLPPSPTSKIQQDQNDENSNETESEEAVHPKVDSEGAYAEVHSPTDLLGYEYSLKEIDEKEETNAHHNEESTGTVLEAEEVSTSAVSTESTVSAPENATENNLKSSEEEKQDHMNLDNNKELYSEADRSENVTLEENKQLKILDPNVDAYSKDVTIGISNGKEESINRTTEVITTDAAVNVRLQDDRPSHNQEPEKDSSLLQGDSSKLVLGQTQYMPNEVSTKTVKTQDAAIQTASCYNGIDSNMLNEMASPQYGTQNTAILNSFQETTVEKSVQVCRSPKQENVHNISPPVRESTNMNAVDTDFTSQRICAQNSLLSLSRMYPVYKQNSEPRPKPSNEITREYTPKIGMTTYKIVPQGSLEALKCFANDSIMNKKNVAFEPQSQNSENSLKCNTKEFGVQTGNLFVSERPLQPGKQYKSAKVVNDQLNGTSNYSDSPATTSSFKCATAAGQTEAINDFRKELTAVLEKSNNTNTTFDTKEKQNAAYPKVRQNSFYLQMQKRVSGLYVESAVAKSANTATSPTQNDLKFKEMENNMLSPQEKNELSLLKTIQFVNNLSQAPTESIEKNSDCVRGEKKYEEVSVISPIKVDSPSRFHASQSVPLNMEKLRTFVTPRPYSNTTPSPFARAVSSAVKRSQSFSQSCTTVIQPLEEETCNAFSPVTSPVTETKNPLSPKLFGKPKESAPEQKANTASSQLNSQVPCSAHHSSSVIEKKTTLPFQNSDPEQIHQSLMAAIRSGEAAARLKRVYVPSNTVSINGRSRLNYQVSSEEQYEH
ncbi:cordon-bleu protein-like 1 isoform X2 [Microcaecilia unicolor]|uniref:Cordon-bleu protein-like 1 isoform X2 n=1 Tax=Microcaecilia unicolor TaxID=1415580 RepID=A0A6P7YNF7_9AMPH|nr:cordon-bleu protein-like 1 isoform X2 [Microcaecilia unicolor]